LIPEERDSAARAESRVESRCRLGLVPSAISVRTLNGHARATVHELWRTARPTQELCVPPPTSIVEPAGRDVVTTRLPTAFHVVNRPFSRVPVGLRPCSRMPG
jgi:hypothetical protein